MFLLRRFGLSLLYFNFKRAWLEVYLGLMFPSEVAPEALGSTTQACFVCVFSGVLSFFINELRSSGDVTKIVLNICGFGNKLFKSDGPYTL